MKSDVKNISGEVVSQIELDSLLFDVEMNEPLVHQALVRQRANARTGTHSTKTRAEVRGGGRKPWRQKGTGRARAGSIRSPIWRAGGVAFGPKPRSYRQDLPVRMRRQALRCVLSEKLRDGSVLVIDQLEIDSPKSKDLRQIIDALGVTGSTLLVGNPFSEGVILSARNLEGVETLSASYLNVGDLLRHNNIVMTVDAVKRAEELWAKDGKKGGR
ncbi:MAG: 50S ribosomal protein L4 [Chloroflexota bacterium]|nr:50S ribosomal protein L4 [Chloroflexota bacterium]